MQNPSVRYSTSQAKAYKVLRHSKRVVMCCSKWLSPPVQWWIMAIISLTCFSSSCGQTLPSRNLHCMA